MNISVISHNTARSNIVHHTILEIARARKTDILLVQEPYICTSSIGDAIPAQHFDYFTIINSSLTARSRAITYIRKDAGISYSNRIDLVSDPDAILLEIQRKNRQSFYLLNIYNEKDKNGVYTIPRALENFQKPVSSYILAGDLNAHHRWWNSRAKYSKNSKELLSWIKKNKGYLVNTPDLPTFYRRNRQESTIDLVFTNNTSLVKDFHLLDESTGSDHEVLGFSITTSLTTSSTTLGKYDFKKANWEKFKSYLLGNLSFFQSSDFTNIEEAPTYDLLGSSISEQEEKYPFSIYSLLDRSVLELTSLLETASNYSIPRIRVTSRSKSWWTPELSQLRKKMSSSRRLWKKRREDNLAYLSFKKERNTYFLEVKKAKKTHWDSYLEKAEGKEIFKALNYNRCYTSSIPALKDPSNIDTTKLSTTFEEKTTTLLTNLFPTPPSTRAPNWEGYIGSNRWGWSSITSQEVKRAIISSNTKKAPGYDGLSFLIIQKAYDIIPAILIGLSNFY